MFTIDLNPPALFGPDARKEIGKKLREYGCTKRAMILCDEVMEQLGFVSELTDKIKEEGIESVIYIAEAGEPTASKCDRAYEFANAHDIDGMVGLGGGATMDTAKICCKLLANGGKTDDYFGYTNTAGNKLFHPLILMPTTAGTGSEVNTHAVAESSEGKKGGIAHVASLAIVDPFFTYNLPASITANTGIDALAHATENLFNTENVYHLFTDTIAIQAIRLVFRWLPEAYENGENQEARMWMSYAATLGGYCLRLRKLTFGHSMANSLSNRMHWPHGIGASIGLAAVIRYGTENIPSFTQKLAEALDLACPEGTEKEVGKRIVAMYDALQKRVDMKNMKEHGIESEFIEQMVEEIKMDSKWKIMTPPDFEVMKTSMYSAYNY